MVKPKVSIIIVSYKTKNYVDKCIKSIRKNNFKDYEIIIINNSPEEDLSNLIKDTKKEKIVISQNLGYSGGNNIGIGLSRGKYILILNPDTTIKKDSIDNILDFMKKNPSTNIVQPLILKQGTNKINTNGNRATIVGIGYCGDLGKKVGSEDNDYKVVPYPSGACFMVRKKDIIDYGLFDESFFMYHEDYDLGMICNLMGGKIICLNKSRIYHDYKFFKSNNLKNYHYEKNRLASILKIYKITTILIILPSLFITELGVIYLSLRDGWFFKKIKGYFFLLANMISIFKKERSYRMEE